MDAPPLELTLVPERRPRQGGDDHRGRPFGGRRELAGDAGFVVVLDEAHEASLVFEVGAEVAAYVRGAGVEQAVVEALVVAVVEAELLELPLEIPVGLGDEQESGCRAGRP